MNQKLPNPIRNALAQPTQVEVHPSPDVLTSFMERTLSSPERDHVTHHLAICAECREAVFLASNAAEDVNIEWQATAHRGPSALVKPWRQWRPGLVWASAAVAVFLVVGALLWRSSSLNRMGANVSTVASNHERPAVTQPAPSTPSTETTETAASAKSASSKHVPSIAPAAAESGRKAGEEHQSDSNRAAAPETEGVQPYPSAVGMPGMAAPVPNTSNSFMANRADILSQIGKVAPVANPAMSMRAFQLGSREWRIGSDGHVEHRNGSDGWTRVLNTEATTFHVVSVVGRDVWAGGEGGALFHSSDNGQHWKRVPLVSGSGNETGTIISINFENSRRGTAEADDGSTWSTTDSGISWTSR